MASDTTSTQDFETALVEASAMGFASDPDMMIVKAELASMSDNDKYQLVRRLFWRNGLLPDAEICARLATKPVEALVGWIMADGHTIAELQRTNHDLSATLVRVQHERNMARKALLTLGIKYETLLDLVKSRLDKP